MCATKKGTDRATSKISTVVWSCSGKVPLPKVSFRRWKSEAKTHKKKTKNHIISFEYNTIAKESPNNEYPQRRHKTGQIDKIN